MGFFCVALFAILISVASGCPGAYDPLIRGRCMRNTPTSDIQFQLRKNCQEDGGELISIHSAEENEALRQRMQTAFVMIGLECNETAKQFYWFDGTPVDYSNLEGTPVDSSNQSPNCSESNKNMVLLRRTDGVWIHISCIDNFYGICGRPEHNNVACNDYDQIENSKTCVSLHSTKRSWSKAEISCQEESAHLASIHDEETNKYIGDKARELGLSGGLHIGLQSNSSSHELAWSDGSNYTYTNYGKGFPNDIFGHCTALQTNSNLGKWISNQCDSSALPYVCGRPAFDIDNPLAQPGCPENPYFSTAATVYSPSYPGPPNATECDYFFSVDEGKKVQVTFDDLDLNLCCDKVELYEGTFGGNLIATLTGEPRPGRVFRTYSSNIMRLVLSTKDGSFVRGFRAHFEAMQ